MNRLVKSGGAIASALFLGALGSGLWEKLLSPFASWASTSIVDAISHFSESYQDSIYEMAARKGPSSEATVGFAVVAVVTLWILTVIFIVTPYTRNSYKSAMDIADRSKPARMVLNLNGLFLVAVLATMFFQMVKLGAVMGVQHRSLNSLEILRPSIGETSYIQLRADFYSMKKKRDYASLAAKIKTQAQRYHVDIPLDDDS